MMCKKNYSGKKHQHTLKNTVISTKHKEILYIGKTVPGSIHDYALFKSECPPQKVWFEKTDIIVDLGYLGIQKDEQCNESYT